MISCSEKNNELTALLEDGFTRKYAMFYLNALQREKSVKMYNTNYVEWAHSKGFLAEYAYAYGLNEQNYANYLSDYDFYKIWPLNSWTRIWVNDKLTLKYMLKGTAFESVMPMYYYYAMPDGGLRVLVDHPFHANSDGSIAVFINTLMHVGEFACKPNNGTMSKGFYKLSYKDNRFFINDTEVSYKGIEEFVHSHPNYVYTEYLKPAEKYYKITPTIHTIRLVVINQSGNSQIIRGYIRFPSHWAGAGNYVDLNGENPNVYTIYADFNVETGKWGNAKLIFPDHVKDALVHPDSLAKLNGCVENYDELKKIVLGISDYFNTLEYIGFDIGITEDGFKLMEINTHPEIRGLQVFESMYSDHKIKDYFQNKLAAIDRMSESEKRRRNGIV